MGSVVAIFPLSILYFGEAWADSMFLVECIIITIFQAQSLNIVTVKSEVGIVECLTTRVCLDG